MSYYTVNNMNRMETRVEDPVSAVPAAESNNIMGKMKNGRRFGSSMMTLVTFVCVQILCSFSVEAQPTAIRPTTVPCSRLLMKGIDNDNLPWLQMTGIYHLANLTVDFFPVYKHESMDMYFYYNRSMKELRFGSPYQNTSILVGAYTNGNTYSVTDSYTKPFNPFYSLITGWYQYDPASQQRVTLSEGKQSIEPTCIPDHTVTCSSGMVEFDNNLKQVIEDTGSVTDVNILGLDYYKQLAGLYRNNRPIYTRMRGNLDTQTYLFYMDGFWHVGSDYTDARSAINAEGDATRPEHVLGIWKLYTNGKYSPVKAKLRCRALADDKACGASPANQCLNGGTCLTSSDGVKKYCGCATGYRGLYCEEEIPFCPLPTELIDLLTTIEGSQPYFVPSLYEGSVLTIFRSLGSRPSYWFSTCDGSTWSKTGITILQPSTTGPTTTAYGYHDDTTRRFTFEWNDDIASLVIPVTVLIMQVINPLIIFCIIRCVSYARASKVQQGDDDELQNLNTNYQTSLDVFRQNHPEPEAEYDAVTATQLSKIHEDYQRQSNEITERKEARMQKSKGKAKFFRIFSLYAYITFWIHLLYVILCSTTRLFGGNVFGILFIISAILVFVTYFIVLLEYKCSSERQYITNLSATEFAVERIEAIRATEPSIYFWAECYHYETRTRTVTYTDANGNMQTRLEAYREKVVSNLHFQRVSFQYWRDTSPPELVSINDKGITKIKMTLSVEPGDEETAATISEKYSAFQNKYRHSDVYVDFTIEKQVKGFEKRFAAYTDSREKPIWVSSAFFMVATFLCLSWPYRWAFNSITSRTEFAVSKLVYIHRPERDCSVRFVN